MVSKMGKGGQIWLENITKDLILIYMIFIQSIQDTKNKQLDCMISI